MELSGDEPLTAPFDSIVIKQRHRYSEGYCLGFWSVP